ncbi:MAG: DinB family protein [Gemmatimonadota bacterium]
MLMELRRLHDHVRWADDAVLDALASATDVPAAAAREFAHVLAAGEIWLSRIEGRAARVALWPELRIDELRQLATQVHDGYALLLSGLMPAELYRMVSYRNSAGITFETSVSDILLHVSLHAQYHRGKVNLLLRDAGLSPAPVDYIAYVRGVAAAITPIASHR